MLVKLDRGDRADPFVVFVVDIFRSARRSSARAVLIRPRLGFGAGGGELGLTDQVTKPLVTRLGSQNRQFHLRRPL